MFSRKVIFLESDNYSGHNPTQRLQLLQFRDQISQLLGWMAVHPDTMLEFLASNNNSNANEECSGKCFAFLKLHNG
jgi:hypothetical protein